MKKDQYAEKADPPKIPMEFPYCPFKGLHMDCGVKDSVPCVSCGRPSSQRPNNSSDETAQKASWLVGRSADDRELTQVHIESFKGTIGKFHGNFRGIGLFPVLVFLIEIWPF